MSRVVQVYNSNYKVAVQAGGTITLDTGLSGKTVVNGNLEVKGTTTTVDSANVTIKDNIIILNQDEQDDKVTLGTSGIEIERGSGTNARWVYDEQESWSLGGLSSGSIPAGTFYAAMGNQRLPLSTPGIVSGGNLYVSTGNGVITVTGTNNYEEKIWNYANSVITADSNGNVIIDDDTVPNAKAVKDYIEYVFANEFYSVIAQGNSSVQVIDQVHTLNNVVSISGAGNETTIRTSGQHGFTTADTITISGVVSGDAIENLNGTAIQITEIVSATAFKVNVNTSGGNISNYVTNSGTISKTGFEESRIKLTVDGINGANFYDNRFEVEDIRVEASTITTTSSNQDLVLAAPGTGTVKVRDVLEIPTSPYEYDVAINPTAPTDGIKLYSKSQGTGKVGLYYVNSNNVNDEIISKNRSLLFSMIF
tara:strand:+ start:587 stop:1852 length:1266 start_codon:yes stop_codon:yes gene_type:complete